MKLKFLYAFENLPQYLDHMQENDAWEKHMITPFWSQIAEYAPFPLDYMKPKPINDKQVLVNQIEGFKKIDFSKLLAAFEKIVSKLPAFDDDPMTIAFYPSNTSMEEGVIGSCVWGNVIININPMNDKAVEWAPFVFAHEYHHNILGAYWYVIKGGSETKGNFLEYLINEGQADLFAQSFYPTFSPSWHKGVSIEQERAAWEKLKEVLYSEAPTEQFAPYMFGSDELGVPPNAGYYFGNMIVRNYIAKHPDIGFDELLQTPHQMIYSESGL